MARKWLMTKLITSVTSLQDNKITNYKIEKNDKKTRHKLLTYYNILQILNKQA